MTSPQGIHPGTGSIEIEWQFEVDDLEGVRAWLESQPQHAPLQFALRKDAEQVDSYYDTADWRLFFAGYSLRRRRREGTFEVTLKSLERASDGPISRREINEESSDGEIPGDTGPVSERVRAVAGRARLERLFEVRTRRRSYSVSSGRQGALEAETSIAQVELDETTVAPPSAPATTFRRVEVEMTDGAPSAEMESFVQAMRYANRLVPTTTSKYEAGLEVASLAPGAWLDFGPSVRDARSSPAAYAYACLREHWASFLQHAPGTRLGEDIEALHQMRVATRRLRATIQVFASVLPAAFEGYRAELQWVGHELGAVRDLDVQIEGLETLAARSSWEDAAALRSLVAVIAEQRRDERLRLLELLDSDRYDRLVEDLSVTLREGPPEVAPGAEAATRIGAFARPVLERRSARLRRDGDRIGATSPSEEYHALRIRGKRLRYSLELFGPLYGKPAVRATGALKALQDLLGDHQDAEVGADRLRSIVSQHGRELPPETLVAVGTLIERYRSEGGRLRSEFPAAFAELRRVWRPLARSIEQAAREDRTPRPALEHKAEAGDDRDALAPVEEAPTPDSGNALVASPETSPAPPTVPPPATPSPPLDATETSQRAASDEPLVEPPPTARPPRAVPPSEADPSGSLSRMRQLFHRD